MSVMRNMLMHMFGRPEGVLGRLGGIIMARTNEGCGAWVTELLVVGPNDTVLKSVLGPELLFSVCQSWLRGGRCGHRPVAGNGGAGSRQECPRYPEWLCRSAAQLRGQVAIR
jgi:hypothetical protein